MNTPNTGITHRETAPKLPTPHLTNGGPLENRWALRGRAGGLARTAEPACRAQARCGGVACRRRGKRCRGQCKGGNSQGGQCGNRGGRGPASELKHWGRRAKRLLLIPPPHRGGGSWTSPEIPFRGWGLSPGQLPPVTAFLNNLPKMPKIFGAKRRRDLLGGSPKRVPPPPPGWSGPPFWQVGGGSTHPPVQEGGDTPPSNPYTLLISNPGVPHPQIPPKRHCGACQGRLLTAGA